MRKDAKVGEKIKVLLTWIDKNHMDTHKGTLPYIDIDILKVKIKELFQL